MAESSGGSETAPGARKSNYYLLESYFLKNGSQGARIHDFFSRGFLPACRRFHAGPAIFLEALVAPHMPQVVALLGLQSLDELATLRARLHGDGEFQKAFTAWESGPEAPYEHFSHTLLKATDYSPDLRPSDRREKSRIFELRVYHSPTWRQLAALHQRFAGPEIKIFHRVGVRPILYTETVIGPNMPNLTYLIPFDSLAAREKAWEAFSADPEWIKVRKESIEAHGQISSVIQIALFRPAPYSPVA